MTYGKLKKRFFTVVRITSAMGSHEEIDKKNPRKPELSRVQNFEIYRPEPDKLRGLQIGGRGLALFSDQLVADLLIFVQGAQTGALNGRDVDEHVRTARIGLNETKTFCGVEPLNRTCSHDGLRLYIAPSCMKYAWDYTYLNPKRVRLGSLVGGRSSQT